jgi:hypothetical protein
MKRSMISAARHWRCCAILLLMCGIFGGQLTHAAEPVRFYRIAMVALTEDPQVREDFEDGLVDKARAFDYDAMTSYDIVPDVTDLDNKDIVSRLADAGVQSVVMMKPAAVGPGSTLESVRDEVSSDVYANMRSFAREISPTHDDDEMVAVIHTAIYMIRGTGAELLTSGAVWLDRPVETQEEGIDKLQDLIVANMNKARPAIRQYLGLPPLKKPAAR